MIEIPYKYFHLCSSKSYNSNVKSLREASQSCQSSCNPRWSAKLALQFLIAHTPDTVMLFILIGVLGQSLLVGTLEMATQISYPSTTLPKTGCLDEPPLNQSRLALSATFKKN